MTDCTGQGAARRLAGGLAVLVTAGVALWAWSGRPVRYGALASARGEPDSSPRTSFRTERVTLTTVTGRRLDCTLRTPRDTSRRAEWALIIAGGRRTGRRAVLYVDSTFVGVAISCEYPWAEQVRRKGVGLLAGLPAIRAHVRATPEALGVVATYLLSRPETDSARLAAIGASLGVPLVAGWASTDPRPRAVVLAYGGGELGYLFDVNLRDRIRWGWLRRVAAGALARALGPLEPTRTVGAIAPRPLLVVGAGDDPWMPRRSVEALYAAAGEPKRLVWFGGEHLRTGDAAVLQALSDTIRV